MDEIKLVKPRIPVYSADGTRTMVGIDTVRILKIAGRMARVIKRKKDNAITRAYLLAEPNEIGTSVTAKKTYYQELPMTYNHELNRRLKFKREAELARSGHP